MEEVCQVCGNEQEVDALFCRFCGTRNHDRGERKPADFHRIVNIEYGKPRVEQALEKLAGELERAKKDGVSVLTIIHGYGASGKGGAIRTECRKMLDYYQEKNVIQGYIAGESFLKKAGPTKAILRRLPFLLHNKNLNRKNKGISIVEM
jgi:hypothetical protein